MYEDKTIICKDCGQEFIFTAGEQEFYAEHGFQNEPQRCKTCRNAKRSNGSHGNNTRPMFDAVCSECGEPCKVPFEPKSDHPIYCRECYSKHRKEPVADGR